MGRNEQGRFASGQPELKPGQPASCQQGPSMLQNEPVRIPTLSNCWKSRASMRSASQEHAQPGTAKWLEMEMEGCFGMHQACTYDVREPANCSSSSMHVVHTHTQTHTCSLHPICDSRKVSRFQPLVFRCASLPLPMSPLLLLITPIHTYHRESCLRPCPRTDC